MSASTWRRCARSVCCRYCRNLRRRRSRCRASRSSDRRRGICRRNGSLRSALFPPTDSPPTARFVRCGSQGRGRSCCCYQLPEDGSWTRSLAAGIKRSRASHPAARLVGRGPPLSSLRHRDRLRRRFLQRIGDRSRKSADRWKVANPQKREDVIQVSERAQLCSKSASTAGSLLPWAANACCRPYRDQPLCGCFSSSTRYTCSACA